MAIAGLVCFGSRCCDLVSELTLWRCRSRVGGGDVGLCVLVLGACGRAFVAVMFTLRGRAACAGLSSLSADVVGGGVVLHRLRWGRCVVGLVRCCFGGPPGGLLAAAAASCGRHATTWGFSCLDRASWSRVTRSGASSLPGACDLVPPAFFHACAWCGFAAGSSLRSGCSSSWRWGLVGW